MISEYFSSIKAVIKNYEHIISDFSLTEKVYSENKGFIDCEVVFSNESKLDFAEVKDIDIVGKVKYRYHYIDEEKDMVFRYDNAKHYPDLSTFPHHKHTKAGVIESAEPELGDILSEIELIIVK